jgi:hypothetical protein
MRDDGWTPSTLFDHFTALNAARDEATKTALNAADKRLDGMNEFRKSLDDAQATYLTRSEAWGFLVGTFVALATIVGVLTYLHGIFVPKG